MRIHFISIGGAVMHNLALALNSKGYKITGSDDLIEDPSKTRLQNAGLLPEEFGWFPEKITDDLDCCILGMHARPDNSELKAAQEKGIKIYSFPEFLYKETADKKRVVIGGSHGKTSTTSMVMHVLKENGIKFDYMVGAQIDGFETMVGLSKDTDIAIFEGDEYLTSPIDKRPKFLWYKPHIALLTGIAWDHINVFPEFDGYVEQFAKFAEIAEEGADLIYFEKDPLLEKIAAKNSDRLNIIKYKEHPYKVEGEKTYLIDGDSSIELSIFGLHNLQNLQGAKHICIQLGLTEEQFYTAIKTFSGAARRLETIAESETTTVFRDFAHSPSKLKATTDAVKEQFKDRKVVACMELHTFSSLQKQFLPEYEGTMNAADLAYVFFSPEVVAHKKLPELTADDVAKGFNVKGLKVFTDAKLLFEELKAEDWDNSTLLLMSSGTFHETDIYSFAKEICN